MTDEELVSKLVEHIRFMISSGQFRGTVERYASFLVFQDDEQREAVMAKLKEFAA